MPSGSDGLLPKTFWRRQSGGRREAGQFEPAGRRKARSATRIKI